MESELVVVTRYIMDRPVSMTSLSQTPAHTPRRSCRVIKNGCRHFLGMGEKGEAKLFDPIAKVGKISWRRLIFELLHLLYFHTALDL